MSSAGIGSLMRRCRSCHNVPLYQSLKFTTRTNTMRCLLLPTQRKQFSSHGPSNNDGHPQRQRILTTPRVLAGLGVMGLSMFAFSVVHELSKDVTGDTTSIGLPDKAPKYASPAEMLKVSTFKFDKSIVLIQCSVADS